MKHIPHTKGRIIVALKNNDSVRDAANELGINPHSLYRLIKKYGLEDFKPKNSRKGRRAKWDCTQCDYLARCTANPYAYKYPCEKEGTHYAHA